VQELDREATSWLTAASRLFLGGFLAGGVTPLQGLRGVMLFSRIWRVFSGRLRGGGNRAQSRRDGGDDGIDSTYIGTREDFTVIWQHGGMDEVRSRGTYKHSYCGCRYHDKVQPNLQALACSDDAKFFRGLCLPYVCVDIVLIRKDKAPEEVAKSADRMRFVR
jgi:hypothetical protein